MSKRKRGRITVQHQPTGAGRFMMKGAGAIHACMGMVFVAASVTVIIPNAGFFGLPFLLGGLFFTANGIRMLVSKNDIAHRVGYEVETDIQGESIVGLMDEIVREEETPPAQESGSVKERLQQLQSLKDEGLVSEEEYQAKRQDILADL